MALATSIFLSPPTPCSASYRSLAHHCCPCNHQHHCTQPTVVHSGNSSYNWIPCGCHSDRQGPLKREKVAKSELSDLPGNSTNTHLSLVMFRKWCWWVTIAMSPCQLNWLGQCVYFRRDLFTKSRKNPVYSLSQYHSFVLWCNFVGGKWTGFEIKNWGWRVSSATK